MGYVTTDYSERIHGCYVCDCRLPVPKHLHLRLRRKCNRRISLAEKLRKLPLAFFGEKNLSDLTATIMDDCTELEHLFRMPYRNSLRLAQHPVDYDRHGILRLGTYTRFVLGGPHFLGRHRPLQKKTAQAEPNELPEQKGSDRTNTGRTGHDSGNQGSGLLERIGRENR